jgi:hypothetical protein
MKYLIFNTQQTAEQRNHNEAINRGCNGVTQYWWGMINHPTQSQWAIAVGNDNLQNGEVGQELSSDWFS